jgi:long-chain acyl-CoA synthetase
MTGLVRSGNSRSITIFDGILAAGNRTPDKVAIKENARALTYAQLCERIVRVANAAAAIMGSTPGRAAVFMPNRIEYIELVCGLSAAGIETCTIGPTASPAEVNFVCDDANVQMLFVEPSLEEMARASVGSTVAHILPLDESYEQMLSRSSPSSLDRILNWENIFSIPYTSGSTGRPKGVKLSHRCRVLSCYAMAAEHACYGPDDHAVATTPMFHGAGFLMALAPLFFGGSVELLSSFDVDKLMRTIEKTRATSTYMVPTHFSSLFAMGDKLTKYDRSSLKSLIVGTAPLAQSMKARIIEYFGEGKLFERYGSTEASIVSALRPKDQLRKQQSIGLPLAATHVRILDKQGNDVSAGEVGELYSTSPYMFSGYLNLPDATERAMRDEWFTAGDLARRDEEGYLYLVDRKNDMIISGGENVYPREVEEALLDHPAVEQAAVLGVPHEHWGEQVVAYVVLRQGMTAETEDLKATCRQRLSRYKVPKEFRLVAALPRNRMGKVNRQELKAMAARSQ